MKNKKQTIIILILTILMLIMMSGCSIIYVWMYDDWVERVVGSNSICWEDNDNVIVYCSLTWCYNEAIGVSETTKVYEIGGELWRINANTGEKELLLRKKGGKYWNINPNEIRIDIANNNIYVSNVITTYKVEENYSNWETEIDSVICPVVSEDEKYIVGTRVGGDVVKYDRINETIEVICEEPGGTVSDYDYSRNYLLVNNIIFVNLDTGFETILIEDREIIDSFQFIHPSLDSRNGQIRTDNIQIDIGNKKIFVNINNLNEKRVIDSLSGILNPNRTKYARLGLFTDTLGDTISTWNLPSDEL